jgi:DNA polymerase elongation subunit (family B)
MSIRIKSRKPVIGMAFRLLDFDIYDGCISDLENGGNSSDENTKSDHSRGSGHEGEYNQKSEKKTEQFIIKIFGLNEKGETCCMYVVDYKPFFYAIVGNNWTQQQVNALVGDILTKIGKHNSAGLETAYLEEHHKLYGFSAGNQYKFVKFVFKNMSTMSRFKNAWYEKNENIAGVASGAKYSTNRKLKAIRFQGANVELYESNIPPLLRYFHIQNISPSGWVRILTSKASTPANKLTSCDYEYICKTSHIQAMNEKETRVPYKICSFDIEASSSHGDFPLPIKSYKRLASNIVDIYQKQQPTSASMSQKLLTKIIHSAFGFSKFDDVDLVYPKNPPNKTQVQKQIDCLLQTPIDDIQKINNEEIQKILTISSLFEKMNTKETEYEGAGGDDNDSDNEGEGESSSRSFMHYKKEKNISVIPRQTLVDLLASDTLDRDDKINIIDSNLTKLFPPLKGDEVTFIGSTFIKYGEKEPYLNNCLVLGDCDEIEGAVIETAKTEKDLLMMWAELIREENPDIIIGYNIFGFDYEFMFRRAQENKCERDFLMLSRNNNEICAKESPDGFSYTIENTTVALASGEYDLKYFRMPGRLQIDMYTYFRRDFNLSSYKLDDVAGQFISDDVKRIECVTDADTGAQTTQLYSANLSGLHVGDFIHIELSGFTSDYYKNGQKFKVEDILYDQIVEEEVKGKIVSNKYNIIVINGHENIGKAKSIKWGMAKDDVTPQDIFRLAKGSSSDRAIVAKYCIQDCNLVHHLMNKIDVLTGYVEMSRICSVPISFLVFRGQGIKLTSYVAKKCREKNTLMPDLDKSGENDGYEGAIVLPPKCSMYMDNPVACVDYSSLYPSSMISNNLSHDSKVWVKEYDLDGNLVYSWGEKDKYGNYIYDGLPGYEYVDLEFDTFRYIRKTPTSRAEKTKCGTKIVRWAQFPEGRKGIMPSILEELLRARSDTRKMAKNEKDPFMQNILDKRQLGYKVTANSLYGQCGAKTSTFYEKDVAASTTATGRMMITYARRIIEEVYQGLDYETECHGVVQTHAEYVYGDTDSVFFTFNLVDPISGEKIRGQKALEITIEIAQHAARLCSDYLKPPMELSYEKTLMPFILLSKKRYVGILYETDPHKGKLKYMGLSLKRRDSCDYLKDTYGGILNILMYENNIQKAVEFLDHSLANLIEGKVSMDKLMLTKALRSDYSNPERIAHRVLADRIGKRDPGNKPKPGDRIKFVFISNSGAKLLGDRIETPEYIVANRLEIDNNYYITNQLMKPLQQLFGLAVDKIWESRGMYASLSTYKKDMQKMEQDFPDLEIFMKKKEKYCSQKVKALLFDKFLTQIYNKKNGIQTLSQCFGKVMVVPKKNTNVHMYSK